MDYSQVKPHQIIRYIGKFFEFEGEYKVYPIEDTYVVLSDCPAKDRGKLVIIEYMNIGLPMFFKLEDLKPNDWEVVTEQ